MDNVDRDAIQPAAERAVAAKAANGAISADEDVLYQILGLAVASRERPHKVVHTAAVAHDEFVKRVSTACRSLIDQRLIGVHLVVHGMAGRQVAPLDG